MYEIKYREISVRAEDGRPLRLSYFVLEDDSQTPKRYGVKVTEETGGETAQALDLTTDAERAKELIEKLEKYSVTPVTLVDVVADWL